MFMTENSTKLMKGPGHILNLIWFTVSPEDPVIDMPDCLSYCTDLNNMNNKVAPGSKNSVPPSTVVNEEKGQLCVISVLTAI